LVFYWTQILIKTRKHLCIIHTKEQEQLSNRVFKMTFKEGKILSASWSAL
jgi:hypothetical protein